VDAVGFRVTPLALVIAFVAALALSAPASASTKPYSMVICALGTSETCAPSPTSPANQPAAVPAGVTSVSMTATFKNENKLGTGINLGSVNLTPPSGFPVSLGSSPLSGAGTAIVDSNGIIELRGLSLPPGGSETLTMSVNTPSSPPAVCTVALPCAWSVVAKQSNDFSGQPGNNLSMDGPTSDLNTVLARLQFGVQPHNVILGQAITSNDYAPGSAVTAKVVDAGGAVVGSYDGPVTLTLNTPDNVANPTPGTLGGTTTQNASGGVASFANLVVNLPANGYTVTASALDLPPAAGSNPFNAQQAAALCQLNASCGTEATSNNWPSGDQSVDVKVNSSSGKASELAQSIDFGKWTAATRTLECGGASAHFAYQAFTTARPLSATIITSDLELTKSNLNASVGAQEICLAQTSPFMAKDVSTKPPSLTPAPTVTLPDGTQGHAGLEPDCGTKSNQVPAGTGPCVTGRSAKLNNSGAGGTLTITDSSPSDRWVN
jgi:hypothetical protein